MSIQMVSQEERITRIKENFRFLRKERIIIYGTGKIATFTIKALSHCNIVAVLDGTKYFGTFEGKPILAWDDISKQDDINVIIIASSETYYKEIYNRIYTKAFTLGIRVYNAGGHLMEMLPWKVYLREDIRYFKKNKEDLFRKIAKYDAISFDLFDTLIMRKTLVPDDVFDIVENNICKKGIYVENFKRYRKDAEIKAGLGNIYSIYKNLQKMLDLTDVQRDLIMQEEISCEKFCLIPRKVVVEAMEYALALGKRVNIISDMYLPAEILNNILENLGITGYEKIYVSCDYGVGKWNGLFDIYIKDIRGETYLHIGDNLYGDIQSAQKSGIDAYYIRKAYDMLKSSAIRDIIAWANNVNERSIIGLVISEVLNNPFAMCGTTGSINISNWKSFAGMFVFPISVIYMQGLLEQLKEKPYDGVLLTARDCFLIKKLWDILIGLPIGKEFSKIKVHYFQVSRKLALSAALETEDDICELGNYQRTVVDVWNCLKDIMEESNILPYDNKKYSSYEKYFLVQKDALFEASKEVREKYYKYMNRENIIVKGAYLVCDLGSVGTVHNALNKIFKTELDGFYLQRGYSSIQRNLSVHSLYDGKKTEDIGNSIIRYIYMLESIFSAPHPSVASVDDSGNIIYGKEKRTEKAIDEMLYIQEETVIIWKEYMEFMYIPEVKVHKELPESMLSVVEIAELEGECRAIMDWVQYDDIRDESYNLFHFNDY